MDLEKEDASLRQYYERRAVDYEAIYYRPDERRSGELDILTDRMRRLFAGRTVLEIACGTGYWTQIIGDVADAVVGIDTAASMLALARQKTYPAHKVTFCRGDAYTLDTVSGSFDGGLANFWLSHVPKQRIPEFLAVWHRRLEKPAVVFMADNVSVPGLGGELVVKDGVEDCYRLRELSDGSKHEVLKNYYAEDELRRIVDPYATDLNICIGTYYWWLDYTWR
jgi:ubiquinone/menaquinone biosynthesis C-methylase UbiE